MRLPGTRNLKAGRPGRWCRILACDLHAPAVDPRDVVGKTPLRPRPRPRRTPAPRTSARRAAAIDALAPRDWFARLEPDRRISRYGYARCPLHDEQIPSLKLYDSPADGWYCWGCGRGGDVIEYAAWRRHGLPGRRLDRDQFADVERWLAAALGPERDPVAA